MPTPSFLFLPLAGKTRPGSLRRPGLSLIGAYLPPPTPSLRRFGTASAIRLLGLDHCCLLVGVGAFGLLHSAQRCCFYALRRRLALGSLSRLSAWPSCPGGTASRPLACLAAAVCLILAQPAARPAPARPPSTGWLVIGFSRRHAILQA